MDSEDFAALDFLVGAIADGGVGVGRRCLDASEMCASRVGIREEQLGSCSDKVQTPPGDQRNPSRP